VLRWIPAWQSYELVTSGWKREPCIATGAVGYCNEWRMSDHEDRLAAEWLPNKGVLVSVGLFYAMNNLM